MNRRIIDYGYEAAEIPKEVTKIHVIEDIDKDVDKTHVIEDIDRGVTKRLPAIKPDWDIDQIEALKDIFTDHWIYYRGYEKKLELAKQMKEFYPQNLRNLEDKFNFMYNDFKRIALWLAKPINWNKFIAVVGEQKTGSSPGNQIMIEKMNEGPIELYIYLFGILRSTIRDFPSGVWEEFSRVPDYLRLLWNKNQYVGAITNS